MTSKYAADTTVPVERSRGEIERTLARYGADEFAYGYDKARALIQFTANGRRVRFTIALPDRRERRFTHTETGKARTDAQATAAWEGGQRQKWRVLALCIKAKLEAVESELVTFEEEFAAHIVLPDGSTVGEHMIPAIAAAYEAQSMAPMLGQLSGLRALPGGAA